MKRDFLQIVDFSREEIFTLFKLCADLKAKTKARQEHHLLKGKTLAMLFQKPSTRTRVSFEVGMVQLGGHALYLSPQEVGLGQRESVADVARVLSRYVDGIMARVFGHDIVEGLARHASVPVINGLSDLTHPCQVMGDIFTAAEHKGRYENLKVAFIGDGNNVANSWINLAARLQLDLRIGCPEGYEPNGDILRRAQDAGLSSIRVLHDPIEAVKDADVVYTDVWASMGQEEEAEQRRRIFRPYQVNAELLVHAADDCLFMHCLPAHRGEEVTDEVIDGPHSIVFDEAENRLHIQKAILVHLMAN
ncbi:MAG: ornithine carbamoyltransferase [candidate division KSB1 bacterium]|nr:ornithine carbamoyltransferase [candidate division KSB1 bacterium]MDZ7346740.1 ornithine carbamoyltransferase [candidate division KSB1 bacterium]